MGVHHLAYAAKRLDTFRFFCRLICNIFRIHATIGYNSNYVLYKTFRTQCAIVVEYQLTIK